MKTYTQYALISHTLQPLNCPTSRSKNDLRVCRHMQISVQISTQSTSNEHITRNRHPMSHTQSIFCLRPSVLTQATTSFFEKDVHRDLRRPSRGVRIQSKKHTVKQTFSSNQNQCVPARSNQANIDSNSLCPLCGQSTRMDRPVRAVTDISKWFDKKKIRPVFVCLPRTTAPVRQTIMDGAANKHTSTNDICPIGA